MYSIAFKNFPCSLWPRSILSIDLFIYVIICYFRPYDPAIQDKSSGILSIGDIMITIYEVPSNIIFHFLWAQVSSGITAINNL